MSIDDVLGSLGYNNDGEKGKGKVRVNIAIVCRQNGDCMPSRKTLKTSNYFKNQFSLCREMFKESKNFFFHFYFLSLPTGIQKSFYENFNFPEFFMSYLIRVEGFSILLTMYMLGPIC